MKLHVERDDIERVGVETEHAFQIKTTAKAFDILSTGLYTDNILAIVRELSCNALDAHEDAGRADEPFEIHLPNRLEPFFSVKDFGTGLSDDDVMELYTTYFDSTKTNSNKFIGALGLGSKSPFSYVKAYEVISRFDGMRRVYSIFINEDGVPSIARLGNPIPTDEHNGLEVKLTVQPADFHRFSSKTSSALKWFPTKPAVVGESYFEFAEPPETDMQGDGWYIYNGGYNSGNMYAVQGNVEYRVNIEQIEDIPDSVKKFLKTVNVISFFDIGDLEVAANREEIRYDKRTKQALVKRITDINKAALKKIEDKADEIEGGMWETILELNKLSMSMFRDPSNLREFVRISEHPILKAYATSQGRVKMPDDICAHDVYFYKWARWGRNLKRSNANRSMNPSADTAVFVNDMRTGGVGRLTSWLKDDGSKYKNLIVIVERKDPMRHEKVVDEATGDETMKTIHLTPQDVTDEYKAIIDGLGNPEVKLVSQDTSKIKRSPSARMQAIFTYNTWNRNNYRPATVEWDRVEDLDFDAGGLYFKLERGRRIMWGNKLIDWSADHVADQLNMIVDVINNHLGLADDAAYQFQDVIGAGSLDVKKFDKADQWTNVFDLFDQAITTYHKAAEAAERWDNTPDLLRLKSVFRKEDFMGRVMELDESSTFRSVWSALVKGYKTKEQYHLPHTDKVRRFDALYGNNRIPSVDVDGYFDDNALEKYPMLEFVARISYDSWDKTNLNAVFEYIKLIDRTS